MHHKTGFLIIAHSPIASSMLSVAKMILGQVADCEAVDVDSDLDENITIATIKNARKRLHNERIFVIQDLPFATPSNMSRKALTEEILIISPLSLPLLLKLINYRDLPLETLKKKLEELKVTAEVEK